jgi:hypothetical protein
VRELREEHAVTERSLLWADGVGDGGPYSQADLRLLVKTLAGVDDDATDGVFRGQRNEFTTTIEGPTSRLDVQSGRGQADGTIHESDATVQFTPAPVSVDTTGGSVVLEKSWSAREVRLALASSADGTAAPPALVQTDDLTWQIRLYDYEVTTGGVVQNLVDRRDRIGAGGGMKKTIGAGFYTLPTAPSSGTTVASAASVDTYGSWVEMSASVAADLVIVGYRIQSGFNTAYVQLDIGTGAASSETSRGEALPLCTIDTSYSDGNQLLLPIPIGVSAGTRLVCRTADSHGTSLSHKVNLLVANEPDLADI